MPPRVSVIIVTFNSLPYIEASLESVRRQSYRNLEVVIVDNASTDGTVEFLKTLTSVAVAFNQKNIGFAAAQNQGINSSQGEWVLTLNPDVVLAPDFISKLMEQAQPHTQVGTVCGKLLRWRPEAAEALTRVIDSTGIYFQPDLRHLDCGAEELDHGQYDKREYVFGATGAAALYRRTMIEEVSLEDDFFDEDFFVYREDADVAWRAQLLGWKCLYVPSAKGWHVRRVTPERRNQLPHQINWHSVKNRFLMRIKNAGPRLFLRFLPYILVRDLLVLGHAMLRDWRLFPALLYPLKHWNRLMRKRKNIQSRRRVSDRELARWFDFHPHSEPVEAPTEGYSFRKPANSAPDQPSGVVVPSECDRRPRRAKPRIGWR